MYDFFLIEFSFGIISVHPMIRKPVVVILLRTQHISRGRRVFSNDSDYSSHRTIANQFLCDTDRSSASHIKTMMNSFISLARLSTRQVPLHLLSIILALFHFPPFALADAPAKATLAKMTLAIESGEFANNFFTGDDNQDFDGTPTHQLMAACVDDKIAAMGEGPFSFQNDFQVDLAACCVPRRAAGDEEKPKIVPDCVDKLSHAYKLIREATSDAEVQRAKPVLEAYKAELEAAGSGRAGAEL